MRIPATPFPGGIRDTPFLQELQDLRFIVNLIFLNILAYHRYATFTIIIISRKSQFFQNILAYPGYAIFTTQTGVAT